ncbi:XtrA/YqaO family protein [Bacillus sonorensis]|uniref:XtrA/YqaO family protein n=1 Tax=Bacillus sonorensis TaxID=119858 RepID=UPI000496E25F|nr:XtrA/YqaO family protein [Bacillus sonorensis]MCY8032502.1 XtrA/YqaO family protein [Bacillus sonorensis]MCY8271848.1 XtrA/YqaO family protein [Bacillus sonorensis]MCY8405712.1 XtrA/YqaO family protein [Bacillus sonorensis]MCY8565198.1 XtrA/YqaO family protein [Bacillus sonorensis]MCY8605615.1 XtrA/YqaO family protein [Bacillus sonorensis]
MKQPTPLKAIHGTTVGSQIKEGKVTVIVLDGVNGAAWQTDAPEHGKTVIETRKGDLARVEFEIGYRF